MNRCGQWCGGYYIYTKTVDYWHKKVLLDEFSGFYYLFATLDYYISVFLFFFFFLNESHFARFLILFCLDLTVFFYTWPLISLL